jgi:hypothetical protein
MEENNPIPATEEHDHSGEGANEEQHDAEMK